MNWRIHLPGSFSVASMRPNLIEITLKDKGNVDSHVTIPEHIKAQTVPIIPEM